MTGIYKITNTINNKCYIGKSEYKKKKRLNEHKLGRHSNEHLQRSIQKYGIENFTFEILEECSKEMCGQRERYWIEYYKSYEPEFGYNKTMGNEYEFGIQFNEETHKKLSKSMTGRKDSEYTKNLKRLGRLGKHHTEESRKTMGVLHRKENLSQETLQKMSDAHKKENLSNETRQKMSKTQKERYLIKENNPFYGKHHTEESKSKISKSHKEKVNFMSDDERLERFGVNRGRVWVCNGIEKHLIPASELDKYIGLGYQKGMKICNSTTIENVTNEKNISE